MIGQVCVALEELKYRAIVDNDGMQLRIISQALRGAPGAIRQVVWAAQRERELALSPTEGH